MQRTVIAYEINAKIFDEKGVVIEKSVIIEKTNRKDAEKAFRGMFGAAFIMSARRVGRLYKCDDDAFFKIAEPVGEWAELPENE